MKKSCLVLLWILLMALLISAVLADPQIGDPPFYKYPYLFDIYFDLPDDSHLLVGPGEPRIPPGTVYPDGKWYSGYWGTLSPESYGRVEGGMAKLKTVSIHSSPTVWGGTMVNQGRASHLAVQLGHFEGTNTDYPYVYPTPRIIFNYGESIQSGTLWLDVRARILDRAKMNYENLGAQANLGFNFQFQPECRDALGNVVLEDYDNPDFHAGLGIFPKVVHFDIFLSNHEYDPNNEYETAIGHENQHINYLPGVLPDADLHVQRVEGQILDTNTWYDFHIDLGFDINRALQMTEDHYYNVPGPGGGGKGFYTLNRLILRNIQLYTEASGALIEAEIDKAYIHTTLHPQPPPGDGNGGGGCPYVSTWNGTRFILDNNLVPGAERSNGTDVVDSYMLQQPLIRSDGKYPLLIWDLDKHSFLDDVSLLAVDHERDVNIAVSPYGEILTYRDPAAPAAATNQNGQDVTSILSSVDGDYFEGSAGNYLILDFGNLDVSQGAKLVFRADFCSPELPYCKESIHVQVSNADGEWVNVSSFIPRMYWSTDIIDMSNYLPDVNGDVKVRLYFTAHHKIDYVGLDTSEQGEFETRYANLAEADHSRLGDVKEILVRSDDQRAELLPSESITLGFTLPQNTQEKRDFIIVVEGHYFIIS